MKKHFFLLILFFKSSILFSQDLETDTIFTLHQNKFHFQTIELNEEQIFFNIECNSNRILSDALDRFGLFNIEFTDFDKDSNPDMMFSYGVNNYYYILYLFDSNNNLYRQLEGFERFPDAIQLETNSNYYYSYQRAGCADENWVSDLFYIENFKTIHIGHIYGKGCDYDPAESPQEIEISKIQDNNELNEILIEKLPYLDHIHEFGEKWEFIRLYWNEHYLKFISDK